MSVVLHISDTHFGTEKASAVEALVALAKAQQPDLVVLSGDITQRATATQFRAAKAFVERLHTPLLAIPGNHDIALFNLWSRLRQPHGRYANVFGAELEPVHATPQLLVLGVNTTRAWRHRHGEVSAAQIARVAQQLRAASPQQLRLVVVHQPVAVRASSDRHDLLRGHLTALQHWSQAGADLVLSGHIHLPYVLAQSDLARRLWVVQAGTAISSRTRPPAPNSVNILRWQPPETVSGNLAPGSASLAGHCLIEQWDLLPEHPAFVRTTLTPVQPERG